MAVSEAGSVVQNTGGLLSSIWKLATSTPVLVIGGLAAGIALGAGTELTAAQITEANSTLLDTNAATVEVPIEASNVLSSATSIIGNILDGLGTALDWAADLANG